MRDGLAGSLVPSKFYVALASGRPVCYAGPANCEVEEVIRREQVGWEGRPGDAVDLAASATGLADDFSAGRDTGGRARDVFAHQFDRPVAMARWPTLLREAVARR